MHRLREPDVLPLDPRVQTWVIFEGLGCRLDDQISVGQGKLLLQLLPQLHQRRHIHLSDQRHLGRGLQALVHTSSNGSTHSRH